MNWLLTDPPARVLCLVAFAALLVCGGIALGRRAERSVLFDAQLDLLRARAELTAVRHVARKALRERDACRAELVDAGVPR